MGEGRGFCCLLWPVRWTRRGQEEDGVIVSVCRWVFGVHVEARDSKEDTSTTCFWAC